MAQSMQHVLHGRYVGPESTARLAADEKPIAGKAMSLGEYTAEGRLYALCYSEPAEGTESQPTAAFEVLENGEFRWLAGGEHVELLSEHVVAVPATTGAGTPLELIYHDTNTLTELIYASRPEGDVPNRRRELTQAYLAIFRRMAALADGQQFGDITLELVLKHMPHQPTLEMIALGTLSHPFILGGLCASTSDPAFPRAFQQRSRLPQASVVREMLNSGRCLVPGWQAFGPNGSHTV
eukprot:tig00021692_g23134.t2